MDTLGRATWMGVWREARWPMHSRATGLNPRRDSVASRALVYGCPGQGGHRETGGRTRHRRSPGDRGPSLTQPTLAPRTLAVNRRLA